MSDTLGDRIKNNYENRSRYYLTRRTPVIVRMDGKAFHTHLAKANKPFDNNHISAMSAASIFLLDNIQGAKAVYTQSDEISLLLTDYDTLETSAYLDYNKSKLESILASYTSVQYNKHYGSEAIFDARAFNLPKEEVSNYFLWRARDWERNSLFMYANSFYSHKELEGKNAADKHEMLYRKGVNWNNLDYIYKNGIFAKRTAQSIEYLSDIINYNSINNFISEFL